MNSLHPGMEFAGYRVLAECGRGGYGRVFLAEDALGRRFAIKHLLSPEAGEYELRGLRNYMQVADRSLALLKVFHCGMDDGCLFYVMEAADNACDSSGEYHPDTLAARLETVGRLGADEALEITHQLLDGLDTLHQAGMLHRDVKPENIIFVHGIPKLADPGLTRNFAETISVAGTPGYIAPEFYSGEPALTAAADLFAVGKLLYRAVTGMPPEQFPKLPSDLPVAVLAQVCKPLAKLCHPNPRRRCQNCAEAHRLLPRKVLRQAPWQAAWNTLAWRPAWRRRACVGTLALLLLGAMAATTAFWKYHHKYLIINSLRISNKIHRQVLARRLDELSAHAPQLDLQLESLGEARCSDELAELRGKLTEANTREIEAALDHRTAEFSRLARKHFPPPAGEAPTPENFQANGRSWGFLASPLAHWLSGPLREELQQRTEQEALALSDDGLLRFGRNCIEEFGFTVQMAFVPPGCFRSPTTRSTRKLDYAYWISTTEITSACLAFYTRLTPWQNTPEQAAEYLTWNDALLFCRNFNQRLAGHQALPPGYAVRLPTEEEWEFAAMGGWHGETPPSREIPAEARKNHAPTTTKEFLNALQCSDFDGNLAELVHPYPELPPVIPQACIARGERYNVGQTGIEARYVYAYDQSHNTGIGGLRPVLAPTPPDYYQRNWFRGREIRHAEIDGAIYAGVSTVLATLTWEKAHQLASDLGASLPEDTSHEFLQALYRRLQLTGTHPCHLDLQFFDGAWRRLSDQTAIDSLAFPAPKDHRRCLDASDQGLVPVAPTMLAPTLVLRWNTRENFARRSEKFLANACLKTFEIDGRRIALCRLTLPSYQIRPFLAFLDLHTPLLDSPQFLTRLLEEIPPQYHCALGPIAFYDQWEQSDGSLLFDITDFLAQENSQSPLETKTQMVLCAAKNSLVPFGRPNAVLIELSSGK